MTNRSKEDLRKSKDDVRKSKEDIRKSKEDLRRSKSKGDVRRNKENGKTKKEEIGEDEKCTCEVVEVEENISSPTVSATSRVCCYKLFP